MTLPIADRWFERRTVAPDLTLLTEPYVDKFLRCNIWHLRGRDRDLLIDTGLGIASLTSAASDLFEKPLAAVATHTHMDHTGGMHEFAERFVHTFEANTLARAASRIPLDLSDYSAAALAMLEASGYEIPGSILTAVPHHGFDPRAHAPLPAPPTRLLTEGDVVDLGNRSFEVLHLPGHSPGSIGLWEKATGVLFSGDAIYDGPLLDELPGSDIGAYVTTMKRLRSLPVDIVHGGHEPSFGRDRLIEIADAYLSRRGA
jgi:glyoxylase-like metal-dependent hydrolase (beta-lactamase superfamily II)